MRMRRYQTIVADKVIQSKGLWNYRSDYGDGADQSTETFQLKEINAQLTRRVTYLQKREKELLKTIMRYQGLGKNPNPI